LQDLWEFITPLPLIPLMPYDERNRMDSQDPQDPRISRKQYMKSYREAHKEELKAKVYEWRKTPAGKASVRRTQLKARDKTNARRREYRRKFPEKALAQDRRYHDMYREVSNARRRERYAENPEIRRAEAKQYAIRHPDRIQRRFKTWYLANIGHHRQRQRYYRQVHPERHRIHYHTRRARKLGLPDTFTVTERAFMLQYWHHACAACGNQEGLWWTLADDHWIPIASPDCPGTIATNMLPLCHGEGGCNNMKQAQEPEEWLLSRFKPTHAKRILAAVKAYFALVQARQLQGSTDA
jgi:hypothetical protein